MALPSNGRISLGDIQTEFGGSNPIALSEYYGADTGVPTSGQIALTDFYGASSEEIFHKYAVSPPQVYTHTTYGQGTLGSSITLDTATGMSWFECVTASYSGSSINGRAAAVFDLTALGIDLTSFSNLEIIAAIKRAENNIYGNAQLYAFTDLNDPYNSFSSWPSSTDSDVLLYEWTSTVSSTHVTYTRTLDWGVKTLNRYLHVGITSSGSQGFSSQNTGRIYGIRFY